jgi:pimeloyl-ACP methyl ester carboxylesterase
VRVTPEYWKSFESLVAQLTLDATMVQSSDRSTRLHLYEAGRPSDGDVILVSPGESPFLLVSPLFMQLARTCRVTSWESRAGPFLPGGPDLRAATLAALAHDIVAVARERQIERPHIVAWCAGALVVVWAIALTGLPVASITLIAPPTVLGGSQERTAFQSSFLQMILELASGLCEDEGVLMEQIRAIPRQQPILNETQREIFELTQLPLRDAVSLKRYAELTKNVCMARAPAMGSATMANYAELMLAICRQTPVAIIHSRDDELFSYKGSLDICTSSDNARLVLYPRGGHFLPFTKAGALAADISSFIRNASLGMERLS